MVLSKSFEKIVDEAGKAVYEKFHDMPEEVFTAWEELSEADKNRWRGIIKVAFEILRNNVLG
jgi:hypothetical protein